MQNISACNTLGFNFNSMFLLCKYIRAIAMSAMGNNPMCVHNTQIDIFNSQTSA